MPLAVCHLSLGLIPALTPILLIQLLQLSDLEAKPPDLFPKHRDVIHTTSISYPGRPMVRSHPAKQNKVPPLDGRLKNLSAKIGSSHGCDN